MTTAAASTIRWGILGCGNVTEVKSGPASAIIDTVLLDYYGTRDDGFWRAPESWPGNRARREGAG